MKNGSYISNIFLIAVILLFCSFASSKGVTFDYIVSEISYGIEGLVRRNTSRMSESYYALNI